MIKIPYFQNLFQIDETTGHVILNGKVDEILPRLKKSVTLTITATDGGVIPKSRLLFNILQFIFNCWLISHI